MLPFQIIGYVFVSEIVAQLRRIIEQQIALIDDMTVAEPFGFQRSFPLDNFHIVGLFDDAVRFRRPEIVAFITQVRFVLAPCYGYVQLYFQSLAAQPQGRSRTAHFKISLDASQNRSVTQRNIAADQLPDGIVRQTTRMFGIIADESEYQTFSHNRTFGKQKARGKCCLLQTGTPIPTRYTDLNPVPQHEIKSA